MLSSWSHSRSTTKDNTLLITNHLSIYGKTGIFLVSGTKVQRASNPFSSLPSHIAQDPRRPCGSASAEFGHTKCQL